MKKNTVLLFCVLLNLFFSLSAQEKQAYNILWIIADDLGAELGCYGDPLVHTPHADQLAKEGLKYTNFYTASPVCSPSRSSFITGMYPTQVQAHHHRTPNPQKLPEHIKMLPEYFKEAGYFVFNGSVKNPKKAGKSDYNFKTDFKYEGTDWSQRNTDQPFFGQIQIFDPHRNFTPDSKKSVDPEKVNIPAIYPDHPLVRKDWALYLEAVQVMDHLLGKVIQRLKEDGLYENTIIVFFGDHGRPHVWDKQFLYDGGIHAPLIIRHPEMSKGGKIDKQLVSGVDLMPTMMKMANLNIPEHLVGQDFYDKKNKAREFVYAQRDRSGDASDRIRAIRTKRYKYIVNLMPEKPYAQMSNYKRCRYPVYALLKVLHDKGGLSKDHAKFMVDQKPKVEFYDLKKDPLELNNLAENPTYQKQLQKHAALMKSSLELYDKDYVPESPETIQQTQQSSYNYHAKYMKKLGISIDIDDEALLNYWNEKLLNQK